MTFESLGLAPALLRALSEQNYATPTPIPSPRGEEERREPDGSGRGAP